MTCTVYEHVKNSSLDIPGLQGRMLATISLMEIALQINVGVLNSPGSLARMSDMLRAADVNVEALFCTDGEKESVVHLIVDDTETAKVVLRDIGTISTTEVLAIQIKNKPGAIAHIARMCAGAKINIHHIYATSLGREAMCYLAVDDVETAKKVLK